MRRRMTHLERAQRAIARNQRKIERINIAIPCASGKRLATLEERKKRAERLIVKWRRVLGKTAHPIPQERPKGLTDAQKKALATYSGQAMDLGISMTRSFSGADQADSEKYIAESRLYQDMIRGMSFEDAFAKHDAQWRAYAAEQARKVAAAPKIKRGPSSGQSTIGHRWVSPDAFAGKRAHMEFMAKKALSA